MVVNAMVRAGPAANGQANRSFRLFAHWPDHGFKPSRIGPTMATKDQYQGIQN